MSASGAPKYPTYVDQLKRIAPFIAIILIVFGILHYFIFQVVTRSPMAESSLQLTKIIFVLGLLSMPIGFLTAKAPWLLLRKLAWVGYIWMGVFNFLFFFMLVEMLVAIFWLHDKSYWVLQAAFAVTLWSLYRGLSFPKVARHILNKPELKGLKLAQISDLHVGMLHLNENWLEKVVAKINENQPDIVTITGDLVEGEFSEISAKLQKLNAFKVKHKFFITGNHEYINGNGPWEKLLTELGFTALHNENIILDYQGAKILMAGVPDRMVPRFLKDKKSLPDMALKTNQRVDYKILLAHQPASVSDLKNETCDLILSGHTHGGQIFPFHVFVRMVQPVVAGFKTINGVKVFAHQGTGLWGPPMRWFSRSEIVIFEWQ